MILTIKSSEEVWKSPDGQRTIWEVTDSDGNKWQTMSRQIAMAINQSLELTTRVSNNGKTYLIKPQDNIDTVQPRQGTPVGIVTPELIERLTKVLERLDKHLGYEEPAAVPLNTPDDLPPASLYDDIGGMEITDDL